MFNDRTDAGIQLAAKLSSLENENVVMLAIPRGGLPVADPVAKVLNAPLDIVLTKKIGHPFHKEYAIGAVSLENEVLSDTAQISSAYITEEIKTIRDKLRARYEQYYKDAEPVNLKNKTVIIIDDGIATGNTILVTVALIMKQQPKAIIVAIPVAPPSAIRNLERHPNIDDVVCLETPINFRAVGQYYETFEQVSDEEAIAILEAHRNLTH